MRPPRTWNIIPVVDIPDANEAVVQAIEPGLNQIYGMQGELLTAVEIHCQVTRLRWPGYTQLT